MKNLMFILILGLLTISIYLPAESCSGPTYDWDPTCGGVCSAPTCQDVSFGEDGSLYQCCPPPGGAPELPYRWVLLLLTLLIPVVLYRHKIMSRLRMLRK